MNGLSRRVRHAGALRAAGAAYAALAATGGSVVLPYVTHDLHGWVH